MSIELITDRTTNFRKFSMSRLLTNPANILVKISATISGRWVLTSNWRLIQSFFFLQT